MPVVEHPQFRMAYDDDGKGQPILFIHGYPLNRKMWQPQRQELSSSFRLILPDLRGHGESTPTEGEYSMNLLAEDCAFLLDQLGITQPITVCGLSMGGYIAFAFLRKYPQRVKSLILTATRAAPDSPEAREKRLQAIQEARSQGLGSIVDSMIPRLTSKRTQQENQPLLDEVRKIMQATSVSAVIGDLQGMMSRPDSRPFLAEINIPTLIIHGREDILIPITEAQEMHNSIRGSRLVILDDVAHLPNMEAPHQFNAHLRNFMDDLA